MLCGMIRKKKKTGTPVYINVYDLMPVNRYAYWFGLGFYHSGVQVYGVEYAFGGSDSSKPGVVKLEPRHFQGLHVRKSILIGRTEMSEKECQEFIKRLAKEYPGNSYNIIYKNCNHFANDTCQRLTKKSIPGWVNRLARLNFLYSCLLPDGWNETPPRPAVVTVTHNQK
ncbi:hypothetical protein R6Q57_023654 [Mikania cordata]